MNIESVTLSPGQLQRVLAAGNPDAALLYLYLRAGNSPDAIVGDLKLPAERMHAAMAMLRQLGLWSEETPPRFLPGERPSYTQQDVLEAAGDNDFRALCGEVQRVLGKSLNTEEMKILLGFTRYLGMSADVISVLVCYCKERARQRGSLRNPSLRAIEKEAYAWAERGIDTMEEASAFIQAQNVRNSSLHKLMDLLQIRGRNLTPAEERYAESWLEMGFSREALSMAYERTCLNTGGLNWAYMNKILQRWHQAGLHTPEQIRSGDQKPLPNGASGELGQAELDAIRRAMREG